MNFSETTALWTTYKRQWADGDLSGIDLDSIRWFDMTASPEEKAEYLEKLDQYFLDHVLSVARNTFREEGPPYDFRMSENETRMMVDHIDEALQASQVGQSDSSYYKSIVKGNANKHGIAFALDGLDKSYYDNEFKKLMKQGRGIRGIFSGS